MIFRGTCFVHTINHDTDVQEPLGETSDVKNAPLANGERLHQSTFIPPSGLSLMPRPMTSTSRLVFVPFQKLHRQSIQPVLLQLLSSYGLQSLHILSAVYIHSSEFFGLASRKIRTCRTTKRQPCRRYEDDAQGSARSGLPKATKGSPLTHKAREGP